LGCQGELERTKKRGVIGGRAKLRLKDPIEQGIPG